MLLRKSCYGDSVTETPTHFNPYRFRQTLSTTHRRLIPCKGYLNQHTPNLAPCQVSFSTSTISVSSSSVIAIYFVFCLVLVADCCTDSLVIYCKAYAVHEHTTRNHRWGLLIVAKCCHHTRNNVLYSAFKEERLPGTWYKQSRQRDSHQLAGSFCWPTGPHSPMFSSMQRSEQHSLPPQADLDEPCAANGGTGVFVAYSASSLHCSAPSRLATTLTLHVTSAPHAKGVTSQLSDHR